MKYESKEAAFEQLVDDVKSWAGGDVNGSGFHAVNCPMCKNATQTTKKGGFKFEGDKIVYNCFRGSCTASTVYEMGEPVSRKFRDLMDRIGVKIPIQLKTKRKRKVALFDDVLNSDLYEKNVYNDLGKPPKIFSTKIPDHWIDFLVNRSAFVDADIRYVTDGDYEGCLAVMNYYYDRLIGWDYITPNGKYVAAAESSESSILIPQRSIPDKVLIVEGIMDSLCFPNTIAVKKSKIDKKQAYHLRRCSEVVVLPDRKGSHLHESARKFGFHIAIPMWNEKDLNEAVCKYGVLVTARKIYDNIYDPNSAKAKVLLKRWLVNDRRKRSR